MEQKEVDKIGEINGLGFGIIGLIAIYLILALLSEDFGVLSGLKNYTIPVFIIVSFLLFSMYFGRKAARKILLNRSKGTIQGAISSIRTLFFSSLVFGVGVFTQELFHSGMINWEAFYIYLILLPLVSFAFGILPAVILGAIFGKIVEGKRK